MSTSEGTSSQGEAQPIEQFPSDNELISLYTGIEGAAREAIEQRKVIGNPILGQKDGRYGISPDALTIGSPVHPFLATVLARIKDIEPTVLCIDPDDLHMTLGELYFNEHGRIVDRKKLVTAEDARNYYRAIQTNLPDYDPIRLRLYCIMSTLDPQLSDVNGRSMVSVAAFITEENPAIHRLRQDIRSSVKQDGLPLAARLGPLKVLFVSLARFMEPPHQEHGKFPILETIDELNRNIPDDPYFILREVNLLSTTPVSYVLPKGHVTFSPQIPLRKNERVGEDPKFLRPYQVNLQRR